MSKKHWPVRIPRRAAGIRAQETRSGRKPWWAARWSRALEDLRIGARLGRGRSYAESGQVVELVADGPHVEAVVVGSREDPYRATFDFRAADEASAAAIASEILDNPMLAARLMVDELPSEVETIFARRGIPLFPVGGWIPGPDGKRIYDIDTHCSCPDYATPCKHAAAVFWLLGEEISRRPSMLLSMRGVELREWIPGDRAAPAREKTAETVSAEFPSPPPALDPNLSPMPLLKRLGPVPYWRGETKCIDELSRTYVRVRPVAVAAARGESVDLRLESEKTLVRGAGLVLKPSGRPLPPE